MTASGKSITIAIIGAVALIVVAMINQGWNPLEKEKCFDVVDKICPELPRYCHRIDSNDNATKAAILAERCDTWAKDKGWIFVEYVSIGHRAGCRMKVPRDC